MRFTTKRPKVGCVPRTIRKIARCPNGVWDAPYNSTLTSLDDDNDVRVTTELGTVILIKVHQDKKMLKYVGLFGFQKMANTSDQLTLINSMNSKVILSRFSMPREDVLLSEYFLPYEEGIPSYQVINGFRLFEQVTLGAIREFDTANLVE